MASLTLTKENGRLSQHQRLFYELNGYLVIPNLIPQDILKLCDQRFENIVAGKVPRGQMTIMKDVVDKGSINKIQDIVHDQVFKKYFEYKELLDIIEGFIGPNILAIHTMLIAKPPDSGSGSSRHPPHQDLYYFPIRPADKIVAAWTAIETCNKENGCLHVLPGSHKIYDIQVHGYPDEKVNKMYHGIKNLPDDLNWINVEMKPGDTVFFHPLLIHGSWTNVSTRTRKAISCHYAAADCDFVKVEGSVQEPIKNEVMEVLMKRYPHLSNISFTELWELKSVLVRGLKSAL